MLVSNGDGANDSNSTAFRGSIVALGDNSGKVTCTGIFIAPTVVLTAGHCVRTEKLDRASTATVIGADSPSARISSQALHPTYLKS